MKPGTYIDKIRPDPDGLDFKGLREEGISVAQTLSGGVWTDYNLHDPGVTLLEALCYALTDLIYRAGLDAGDYLVSDNGEIHFENLGLFRPDDILPCRPLTDNDYRKLILNAIPGTDNVWIGKRADQPGEIPGVRRIYALLGEQVSDQCNESAKRRYEDQIAKVYSANRNLCEDLGRVEIVERMPYSLRGEIETDGKRDSASLLAEIYFECARYLSPRVGFRSYLEAHAEGVSLEELFTGVLTGNGYIPDDELHEWRGQFSIPELVGKISRIEGVKSVWRLSFVDPSGKPADHIDLSSEHARKAVACLRRPATGAEGVTLRNGDKVYQASAQDIEMEYSRLDYKSQALRYQKNTFDWVGAMLPKAARHKLNEYFSIQNHLPAVYGINSFGVPDSYPAKRKGQAMQLKAYLLVFEQIMANFLQNTHKIRRLFSLNENLAQSYFVQVLGNAEVAKAEQLYFGSVKEMEYAMARKLAQFDNFGDRRNRVLDYLLGIYGEKFGQHSLKHFFAEGTDGREALIRNKIAFMKNIVEIGGNRAAAFDYRQPFDGEKNGSGLLKKLKLLLGLAPGGAAPTGEILGETSQTTGENLHIVEHILLRPLGKHAYNTQVVREDFYPFRISVIFHSTPGQASSMEFRKLAEQTVYINCPAHIYPEIFWLDAVQMREFNRLHDRWMEARRMAGVNAETVNAAAQRLAGFLLELGK